MNQSTLENYISQGLSTYQIAELENKGQTTIRFWLRKFGLKTNHLSFKNRPPRPLLATKVCPVCKEEKKTETDFYQRSDKLTHAYCKSCVNKQVVDWQRSQKIAAVNYKGGKCSICGYSKCYAALDFHHTDPSRKDFNISRKKNCNIDSIKPELDKCVLLCKNCHAEVHFGL